ncbi:M56 family metallopeptidase [Phenylobacterium sp.]|jgi:beta-lactamase regulating signal transducer with metallopeptidase domain|uniref:M56 family metallopeptidase n=1 Tax=Phenylobacterium sp. TaxID=1871053 RepID=UPI002F942C1A
MVDEILPVLLRVNVAAGAAILLVIALRTTMARRFGAEAAYALWLAVPLAALTSVLPARRVLVDAPAFLAAMGAEPTWAGFDAAPGMLPDAAWNPAPALFGLWIAGAVASLAVLGWRQRRFSRALGRLRFEGGVYRAEARGVGPALVGTLRPRIVLPADFEAQFSLQERAVVLAHEEIHLRRGDHLVNAAVALLQALNWFNPLVHAAARRLRIDQELACDAAVVARHPQARRSYAEAMLKTQLSPVAPPLGCNWPAAGLHPLRLRIALLAQEGPSAFRRVAGLGLVAALSLTTGVAAWAAQPPQPVAKPLAPRASSSGWTAERPEAARNAAPVPAGASRVALGKSLVEASSAGDGAAVDALIQAGADVNAEVTGDGSPLIVAAREGRLDIATRLVAGGADVNGFVLYDETPLINAARMGHLAMVRFLVDRGADPSLAVPSGNLPGETRSPLKMAANKQVADYLRSRGARR